MKYCSTRGGDAGISFETALMKGYASDGGMYLPETIPVLTLQQLQNWSNYSYEQVVYEIMRMYIDSHEIPEADLLDIIKNAYAKFPTEKRITISHLENGLKVAELYHGPTMAFKDLPMVCVGQLMEYFLQKRNKHATVIVCTSGDTGGSAVMSMKGSSSVDLIVLYPKGHCNEIQELQMITELADNIHCLAVEGNSDEEDEVMIDVLCDIEFASKHNLGVMNSVNWGRIMVQIAHFVYIHLNIGVPMGGLLQVIIPTGGAGNLLAGCIAHIMGLPIHLIPAVNENKAIHKCLQDGVLRIGKSVVPTLASAMDIQVPYNFERILHLFSGNNGGLISGMMKKYYDDKQVVIPNEILKIMKSIIVSSYSADNSSIVSSIKRCWEENNYLICPHTAAAVSYHYYSLTSSQVISKQTQVCMATASPLKFPEVISACGIEAQSIIVNELRKKKIKYEVMLKGRDWKVILREKIMQISKANQPVNPM